MLLTGGFTLDQLARKKGSEKPKGFYKQGGKTKPINEKKGVKESDMKISVKGNNDTIRVDPKIQNHHSQMLEGKKFDQRKEIPISPMNVAGKMVKVPFVPEIWNESLRHAMENKQWAEKTQYDEQWMNTASEVSKEALRKYLDLSVRELAIDYYQYWYLRSHAPVESMYGNYGEKSPIDPEFAERWEKFSGRKITQADFIKL